MRNEGSKNARATLKAFHRCLNSPSLVPSQTYTPTQIGFRPVCMVNQVVSLMFSNNYERVPFCIRQAYNTMSDIENKPVFEPYKKIALAYLSQVSYFLKNFTDLEHEYLEQSIPHEILCRGEQPAPEYEVSNQTFKSA